MTELKPCPFCGAGTTEIVPNGRVWTGMKWGEPTSVSVRHWCVDVPGQPSRMLERVGRDEASAIEAWNRRAAHEAQPVADERDALLAALTRLWPMIDKGTRGFVFTAERAGEVAADMAVVKAAIDAARKEAPFRPAVAPAQPARVPLDAIREVMRISDRTHPAWDAVKLWLESQR